jgi:hypothetical protein
MDMLSQLFRATDWRLLIGPTDLSAPKPSWDVDFLPRYEPKHVAAAILAIAGFSPVTAADPDSESWVARWESDGRVIVFREPEVLPFDTDGTPRWCGCDIDADCRVEDMLAVWEAIHRQFPGIWLYAPDSWYQTRESFMERCGRT